MSNFDVTCSGCGKVFASEPGVANSTGFLGMTSVLYGNGGYLPKCPVCGNWRGNRLVNKDRTLSEPLRI